jgi:hypothetical protein
MKVVGSLSMLLPLATIASADGGAAHQVKQSTPVKMGTSGGSANDRSNSFCCGGTLGALVMRDGVLCILSNNHVLARSGSAANGEDTVQPGLIDSNCSPTNSNIVGDFAGDVVPLGSANVDVGLSTARNTVDASGAILDIGVPRSATQNGSVGMAVMKSGRTTGFTTGSITATNASVSIQYQKGCNQGKKFSVVFTNQLVTGPMSAGGDSGSVLFSNDGSPNPVGLLFAGSGSTTIYNPVQDVVNALTAGGHTFSFVGTAPMMADTLLAKRALGPAPSPEDIAMALQVKVENESELMKTTGVLGVGVGAAEDNPYESALVVLFDRSQVLRLPERIDGFKVRVIVTDPIVAQ